MYLEQFDDVIKHSMPKAGLAAFFAESIQGVGGTVQFPRGFLKRAFDMVRAKGGLCVSDEVWTNTPDTRLRHCHKPHTLTLQLTVGYCS